MESTPIIYRQTNPVSSCLVSWTPADKESLHPVVLPPRKDKLSLSSVFRESAVSLPLSCISMVSSFLLCFVVNGIFCDWISLTESSLVGVYLMVWNRYMKLGKKYDISKVNFRFNLLIYNGIDLVSNWIFWLHIAEYLRSPTKIIPENQSLSLSASTRS